jgi:hypothetical protein
VMMPTIRRSDTKNRTMQRKLLSVVTLMGAIRSSATWPISRRVRAIWEQRTGKDLERSR